LRSTDLLPVLLALLPLASSGLARADSEPETGPATYETVVTTTRTDDGLDAQRRLDEKSHGFATAIEVDFEAGARPADALPELVSRAPGATVRSVGGLGQFSAVSLRGSSAQQVALFLDGVPLASGFAGLVDLSNQPLDALSAVEIYRGFVPVTFGGDTIGGAVNLVGRVHHGPASVQLDAGLGSFGARQARLAVAVPVGDQTSVVGRAGFASATGDFPFLHDGNTPLDPSNDRTETRRNNDYERFLGQLRLDGRRDAWRYGVQQLVLWKSQGIPGPFRAQTEQTRLGTEELRTTAKLTRTGAVVPAGALTLVSGVGLQRHRFQNPDGQFAAQAPDQVMRSADMSLQPSLRLPLWQSALVTGVADARFEWVEVDDRNSAEPGSGQTTGDATRSRARGGAGLQLEQYLLGHRIVVAPALRADVVDSRFRVPDGEGEQDDAGNDSRTVGFSPRIGLRARLLDWLELRASGGRYFRPPTLLELFGDRGPIRGNEGLRPERGTGIDVGLVSDLGRLRRFGAYLQVAGFVSWSEDLIDWSMTGNSIRFENLDAARVGGVEVGVSAHAWGERLRLHGTYTYLHSRSFSRRQERYGKQLPGRPTHDLFARLSFGDATRVAGMPYDARLFYTVERIAGTFVDPSGRRSLPPRTLHGAGVEVRAGDGVRLALEARNLLDTRSTTWTPPVHNAGTIRTPISDFIGYPLPGRSVWLNVTLDLNPAQADGDKS
jgi:iron complex outermembrane receptor protein